MTLPGSSSDPLWYKDAVIYQLHVKTFCDSNGDGIGDFRGLISRLGYLQRLGVSCLWLMPFYQSPLLDDGYDVSHCERIHPAYGTMADFREFLAEAHRRDLRVITELVVNHTSDQHPWFKASRRAAPGSSKRDFYVWSDTTGKYPGARIIFRDTEASNWSWDPVAGAYFWHRFFHHQPDLNFDNPHVCTAVLKIMRFWLDMGVDGLRLDAVAHLCEREGTTCDNLPETHAFLKQVRADLERRYPGRVLLADVNQTPEVTREYLGVDDECHMAFNFPLVPRIFQALATEQAAPIVRAVEETSPIPDACQWGIFLRNHDELALSALQADERAPLMDIFAPNPRMRLNLGIHRRLAPLLDNRRERIELAIALTMSLPGTPIIYYGDEIAMGDQVELADRDGVRTPMQWSPEPNGGFTQKGVVPVLPVIDDPVYGYKRVNVAAQAGVATSLLTRVKQLIAVRREHPAFGRGTIEFLDHDNARILAFRRRFGSDTVIVVANLSSSPQVVTLTVRDTLLPVTLDMRPSAIVWWLAPGERSLIEERGAEQNEPERQEADDAVNAR